MKFVQRQTNNSIYIEGKKLPVISGEKKWKFACLYFFFSKDAHIFSIISTELHSFSGIFLGNYQQITVNGDTILLWLWPFILGTPQGSVLGSLLFLLYKLFFSHIMCARFYWKNIHHHTLILFYYFQYYYNCILPKWYSGIWEVKRTYSQLTTQTVYLHKPAV